MKICVDIDQTISSGFLGASVEESLAYYRSRQVVVPPDARHYRDFFGLPEVIRVHEEIPHARCTLHFLAKAGYDLGYFTVRHSDDPCQQERIRANTKQWLIEHQFPHAAQVFFFPGMPAKLYDIGKRMNDEDQTVVMVDDSWEKVLDAYERIQNVDPFVAQRLVRQLVLLAFGATQSSLSTSTPIKLMALPDWTESRVKEMFDAIAEGCATH